VGVAPGVDFGQMGKWAVRFSYAFGEMVAGHDPVATGPFPIDDHMVKGATPGVDFGQAGRARRRFPFAVPFLMR
jgi:hypothetical protein